MVQPPYPPPQDGPGAPGGDHSGWREPTHPLPAAPWAGQQPDPGQQPPYGGSPGYGPLPYGRYGQPPYTPPPYGAPVYGPQVYGQPPYGSSVHGPPPYGSPRRKTSAALVVSLVVGVLVVVGLGVALLLGLRGEEGGSAAPGGAAAADASSGGIPPSVQRPTDLGGDPAMDRLAQECYGGDMQSCDDLFRESPLGSDYETYGGTCAGRQPVEDSRAVYCTDAFPG